ncbi:hypothetical protein [Pedobacter cryotolerans]|uniref:hypothetical protein n=1 Tax=Pedobacter cryotolerans TaxID=2571270 RepID=UPI00145F1C80|nr:hypothetical protein [Pedobacter cryotolerans]
MQPLFKGMGLGLSTVGYNTAKTKNFDTSAGSATFTNPIALKNEDVSSMTASL